MKNLVQLTLTIFFFGVSINAYAGNGTDEGISLVKTNQEITIDGILNEDIWKTLKPFPMTQYSPLNGEAPTERTEIMLTYDDKYMYVGARMYVSNPDYIRITTYARDVLGSGSELQFFFTSDYQNLEGFGINPAGRRVDAQILCNTDCADFFNLDWNVIWEGNSVITEEGWFTEVRVPLSTLNFTENGDRLESGLILHRVLGAKREVYTYPNIPLDVSSGTIRASQASKISIENVKQQKPLYVTPYIQGSAIGGTNTTSKLDGNFGGDARFKPSRNTTIDVTYNTDFSQVESDEQQLNLSQFSLFFPEKRQFFQERSGIFSFSTGGSEKLFYSRRIGLSDEGQAVKILGGVRAVSRIGGWDVGLINMQTGKSDAIGSENFGVFRAKRNILNASSHIGTMVTNKVGQNNNVNTNVGLDLNLNLFNSDYLILKGITTFDKDVKKDINASFLSAEWIRPANIKLGYQFAAEHRGKNYNPEIGFVTRNDHFALNGGVNYGWMAGAKSKVQYFGPTVSNYGIHNYSRKLVEYNATSLSWDTYFKSGNVITIGMDSKFQDIEQGFNLANGVSIPAKQYTAQNYFFQFAMSNRNPIRVTFYLQGGQLFDGKGFSTRITPTWIVSEKLELSGMFQRTSYAFDQRSQELKASICQAKIQYSPSSKLSLNVLGQYNSTTNQYGINGRLRYNFQDGRDLYVVCNTAKMFHLNPNAPEIPADEQYGVFVKYLYTFVR